MRPQEYKSVVSNDQLDFTEFNRLINDLTNKGWTVISMGISNDKMYAILQRKVQERAEVTNV